MLEGTQSKIANFVLLPSVDLPIDLMNYIETLPSMTDNIDIAIGDHNHVLDVGEQERAIPCFPPNFAHSTRQSSNGTHSALNLAFLLMSKTFYELHYRKFDRRSLTELDNVCRYKLKYGEQLSNAIHKCDLQKSCKIDTKAPTGFNLA